MKKKPIKKDMLGDGRLTSAGVKGAGKADTESNSGEVADGGVGDNSTSGGPGRR